MSGQNQAPQSGRNFKKVVRGGNFLKPKKWEDWSAGDFVEGEYVNASELDLYGKPIYEIKVDNKKITGADPTILTGDRAGIMPLYPNGAMVFQMDNASYGDVVRITYNGMAVSSGKKDPRFKGKPCHDITVEIDGYVAPEEAANTESDLLG
jgi:hypothetical protein